MKHLFLTIFAISLIPACGSLNSNREVTAGAALRDIAGVKDLNPEPHIIEFELTAAATDYEFISGRPTTVWTYNGQLPGPLIEATVGDEIIVHFRNELPEETTVHWHGIRLPAAMDGSHLSQHPVMPVETFEYRFTVPDAGLFWYHPHHNGSTQIAMGLYGPLLVHAAAEPPLRERVIVLSDALLSDDWQMIQPGSLALSPIDHAIGVHGNRVLVNGQFEPAVAVQPNSRERWRIVNATASRYFKLSLPGATLHQIGGDIGLADRALAIDELELAIGERADLIVTTGTEDTELLSQPTKRIHGYNFEAGQREPLLSLRVKGDAATEVAPLPSLAAFTEPAAPVAERSIQFSAFIQPFLDEVLTRSPNCADPHCATHGESAAAHGLPSLGLAGAEFYINGFAFPNVPVITSQLGTTEIWSVNNHTEMDHPFHLHGFRFLVLDVDGVPPAQRMWKDTINIEGSLSGEHTARLLVDFSGHPGEWVYHCHILHHQEKGMMAQVNVE